MLEKIARAAGIDYETLMDPEHPAVLLIQSGNLSTDTLWQTRGNRIITAIMILRK